MDSSPLRLMLVDDHEIVRMGIRTLLEDQPDLVILCEAATAAEAIAEADRCLPDLILMDVRLPDVSGVEACREIRARHPEVRVIMLTSYPDDNAVMASIMAGASGYVLKQTRGRALIEAIRTVGAGGSLLDPAITEKVLERIRSAAGSLEDKLAGLTDQERHILALVAEGKTNKEIAEALHLSAHTVKNYVSDVLKKLGAARRAEAVAYYTRRSGISDE
jgi:DNA-binding NarL/FixJ family response regulator